MCVVLVLEIVWKIVQQFGLSHTETTRRELEIRMDSGAAENNKSFCKYHTKYTLVTTELPEINVIIFRLCQCMNH